MQNKIYQWHLVNSYVHGRRIDNYRGKRLGKIISKAGGIEKAKMFLAKQIILMYTVRTKYEKEITDYRHLSFYDISKAQDIIREIVDELKLYEYYVRLLNQTTS